MKSGCNSELLPVPEVAFDLQSEGKKTNLEI